MKRTIFSVAAGVMLLFICCTAAFAQLKIGYVNSQEILQLMPDRDSASKIYDKFLAEIQKEFETMNAEYTNLQENYLRQKDSLTDFIKKAKEAELRDKGVRIQEFQTIAQQELDKKRAELMAPIEAKMNKAIKDVAEANKFTYVLDVYRMDPQLGAFFYYPEDQSLNLMPLVKAKLGIN